MATLSRQQAVEIVNAASAAISEGFRIGGAPSVVMELARRFGEPLGTIRNRLARAASLYGLSPAEAPRAAASPRHDPPPVPPPEGAADAVRASLKGKRRSLAELTTKHGLSMAQVLDIIDDMRQGGANVQRVGDAYEIPSVQREAYTDGAEFELTSLPDSTFRFAAIGDLHAGSKYCRWDVREDLIRRAEDFGAQAIFDTGNWIEGEARFNKHDLLVHGMDAQCRHLAERHPITDIPIYAVAGDDHEGWYGQREGVDIGRYCENIMRQAGHNWTNLGFMEAHVALRNADTGKAATLAVVHPGGGSAYALSYSIQKIVESYEGGEKPHVGLYGHYHKLWAGLIRNIWCVQTGTAQDQTPFMRKKRLEAHVGGTLIELEQDPETGAILAMTPKLLRYFNKGWYAPGARWSHSEAAAHTERSIEAIR